MIGGVAGSLLVFVLTLTILLLLFALVWITKKHKRVAANKVQYSLPNHHREPQLEGREQREEQHGDDEDTEMKSNDAYVSATHKSNLDNRQCSVWSGLTPDDYGR